MPISVDLTTTATTDVRPKTSASKVAGDSSADTNDFAKIYQQESQNQSASSSKNTTPIARADSASEANTTQKTAAKTSSADATASSRDDDDVGGNSAKTAMDATQNSSASTASKTVQQQGTAEPNSSSTDAALDAVVDSAMTQEDTEPSADSITTSVTVTDDLPAESSVSNQTMPLGWSKLWSATQAEATKILSDAAGSEATADPADDKASADSSALNQAANSIVTTVTGGTSTAVQTTAFAQTTPEILEPHADATADTESTEEPITNDAASLMAWMLGLTTNTSQPIAKESTPSSSGNLGMNSSPEHENAVSQAQAAALAALAAADSKTVATTETDTTALQSASSGALPSEAADSVSDKMAQLLAQAGAGQNLQAIQNPAAVSETQANPTNTWLATGAGALSASVASTSLGQSSLTPVQTESASGESEMATADAKVMLGAEVEMLAKVEPISTETGAANLSESLDSSGLTSTSSSGAGSDGTSSFNQSSGREAGTDVSATTASTRQSAPTLAGPPLALQKPEWTQAAVDRVMWMSSQNLQSAEIRLDPAELGHMEVRIDMLKDQAQVTFMSAQSGVRDAVEAQLPRLRELFSQQGLNLSDVNVSDQSASGAWQGAQDQAQARQSNPSGSTSAESDETVFGTMEVSADRSVLGQGLVDYYA